MVKIESVNSANYARWIFITVNTFDEQRACNPALRGCYDEVTDHDRSFMMMSTRLTALAAVFTLTTACVHAAPGTGAVISLSEHQSATVAPGAILTYDSVNDSRCPPDVHCVMAGRVVYSFTLKQGDTLEHFTLTPAEPAFTSAALGGKRITLADAAPPPIAKLAASSHPVSIQVVAP